MDAKVYFGIGIGIISLIVGGYFIFNFLQRKRSGGLGVTPISAGLSIESSPNISYLAWLKVNDFTKNYGLKRPIFSTNGSPDVSLDASANSLLIEIKTLGNHTETITIPDIPTKKWFHLIVQIDKDDVHVFINGILKEYHTLSNLPKMDNTTLTLGNDWNGEMSGLSYINKNISENDIAGLVGNSPDNSPSNYFSLSWYLQ
jgi:hypothetical protein